jgi:hypothetical protein
MKLKTLILPAVMALVLGNVAFAGAPAQDGMKADNAAPAVSVKEDTQAGGKGAPAKAAPKQVAHKAKHHKHKHHKKHAKAKKVAKKAAPKAAAKPAAKPAK